MVTIKCICIIRYAIFLKLTFILLFWLPLGVFVLIAMTFFYFFKTYIYPFIWPHCNISLHKAVFYYVTCEISPQWHFCKKALLYITFSYNVQWTICIIKFRQTDNSNFATSYTVYISVPKLTLHNSEFYEFYEFY